MRRGGVLVRVSVAKDGRFVLVPAEVVRGVFVLPSITPVEGLRKPAAGVALANGEVVTVLCIDEEGLSPSSQNERTTAVLCDLGGEPVAIVGRAVESSGLFEEARDGFVRAGETDAAILDVAALRREAEEAIWTARTAVLRSPEAAS
ncbi:MAG TPA: chemotaxis protein CheW [Polyangium sp.]|nr:chemotaxis protein CheW [Polyangium sp.]